MKVAVIGSRGAPRSAVKQILHHLPADTTEVVSGGAQGIDRMAAEVARSLSLPLREFLPDYAAHGRKAPLVRNRQIVEYADRVLAFWDGQSRGTAHTIAECVRLGKPVQVILLTEEG